MPRKDFMSGGPSVRIVAYIEPFLVGYLTSLACHLLLLLSKTNLLLCQGDQKDRGMKK